MEINLIDDCTEIKLSHEEFRSIYMIVYASLQFIDDIDFASVTGILKQDARKVLLKMDEGFKKD